MNKKQVFRLLSFSIVALAAILLAWSLRWHAVKTLNTDYDEDDYLRAAQEYANLIRSGKWEGFLETNYRYEHPPLAKIVYGFALLGVREYPLIEESLTSDRPSLTLPYPLRKQGRTISAIFGVITVGILALINPLAGLFLAIHSFTIKYVSQVMIESLPALTSLLVVVFYSVWRKSYQRSKPRLRWLVASAVFLGMTAASKYLYCVAGIAVLIDLLSDSQELENENQKWKFIILWSVVSLGAFFLFDPYLWPDPIGRLQQSILFHQAYSTGAVEVESANFPIWQPFIWLTSTPKQWQPETMPIAIDPLITFLACFGFTTLWKKRRVYSLWLIVAILFLLIWPTKWPQYIVILTAPLSLAAAEGASNLLLKPIHTLFLKLRSKEKRSKSRSKQEIQKALPWLLPGTIIFLILTILPLLYQFAVSLTDFNAVSIRDGLNGGILREVWGGLTGTIPPRPPDTASQLPTVNYIGPAIYLPALKNLYQEQVLFFNILWTVVSVALQTILGTVIALLLWQRGVRFKRWWTALFILPWAIPEMIGALMWVNVFQPRIGWLSLGVQDFGASFPFAFLNAWPYDMDLVMLVLLISGVWYGFPFMMLAATTGLKMLPLEVYDAAAIDGANYWQTFKYLTRPLLTPLVIPAFIIRGIFAFNQFYLFQSFGFEGATLSTVAYNIFREGQYSISAVVNILTVLILLGFVFILNKWSRTGEGMDDA